MRIVSLLPSATETLCALGLADSIVGISHACDYPADIADRPRVTRGLLSAHLPSEDIHREVQQSVADRTSLYRIDVERLANLAPDLVVTQEQCRVCAVGKSDAMRALEEAGCKARVLSLSASRFSEVWDDILLLGRGAGAEEPARALVGRLRVRLETVRRKTAAARRPRVFCLSWFRPLMAASHWLTEMVELAGGIDGLGSRTDGSTPITADRLKRYAPEVIVLMPCGFPLTRTLAEWRADEVRSFCAALPAVGSGRVFAVEGSLFHRPGPRLADAVEMLACLLHPLRVRRRARHDDFVRRAA